MKSYKIAVCLSGEPRTWQKCAQNILDFYSSETHEVVFFGHSWSSSRYKKEHVRYNIPLHENQNIDQLRTAMLSIINYRDLLIEDKTVVNDKPEWIMLPGQQSFLSKTKANLAKPIDYTHMSYSIMMANWLKTQYEINNDIQFDIVVRARHDLYYTPEKKFENFLPEKINPVALYGNISTFPKEYWQHCINDTVFFGSSIALNIACDFYRYYSTGKFWKMIDAHWNDPYIKLCGYNVALHKWLNMKNIFVINNNLCFDSYVFRKSAQHLSLPEDHESIFKYEKGLFL